MRFGLEGNVLIEDSSVGVKIGLEDTVANRKFVESF